MNAVKTIWIFLLIAGLNGCATMSQKECMSSDWSAVGYDAGYRGHTANQFSKHHKACAKHGITADFQSYQSGREQGLLEFCKPKRAFQFGSQGKQYHGVCPEAMEPEFHEAYQAGKRLHKLQSEIRSIQSKIRSRQKELGVTESDLATTSELLVSEGVSVLKRAQLLEETLELNKTKEMLEDEIYSLEHKKIRLERQYTNYRESTRNVY